METLKILRRSFQISGQYPYLWVLALLSGSCWMAVTLPTSPFAGTFIPAGPGMDSIGQYEFPIVTAWLTTTWQDAQILLHDVAWVTALLAIGLFVLSIPALGGLIWAGADAVDGHARNFSEAWRVGREAFWPLLVLRLALALAGGVVLLVQALLLLWVLGGTPPFQRGVAPLVAILVSLTVEVLLVPVYGLLWLVDRLASPAVVLDRLRTRVAAVRAFRLVVSWTAPMAAVALVGLGSELLIWAAAGIVDMVLIIPFRGPLIQGWTSGGLSGLVNAAADVGPTYLLLASAVAAPVATLYVTYWTLAYRRLAAAAWPGPPAGRAVR